MWIDREAPPKSQTMWISLFFLTVPLGIILGYGMTVAITSFTSYRYAFFGQTVLMIAPITILFLAFQAKYYQRQTDDSNKSQPLIDIIENSLENSRNRTKQNLSGDNQQEVKADPPRLSATARTFTHGHQSMSILDPQALPIGIIVKNLLLNPTYMLSVLAITNVMFILTALQFWTTQYAT